MLAFHGLFGAYGFWLPNDPAGSWSSWVRSWELFRYGGPATTTRTRRSVASARSQAWRRGAERVLKHRPVVFNGQQARAVARGFAAVCGQSGYHLWACCVMPEHVHVVVAADGRDPARVIGHLKRGATDRLITERLHPFGDRRGGLHRSCWADQSWRVFLDTREDVRRGSGM